MLFPVPRPVNWSRHSVKAPTPDVPELYTIKGEFTRIAYNNEGWVTLGYRTANSSQGDEWMLLEAGVNLLRPHPNHTLTRAVLKRELEKAKKQQ